MNDQKKHQIRKSLLDYRKAIETYENSKECPSYGVFELAKLDVADAFLNAIGYPTRPRTPDEVEADMEYPNESMFSFPEALDDQGLNVAEFRLYCHFARYAPQLVKEGIVDLAKNCRMAKATAIESLRNLQARGMITINRHPSGGNVYGLTQVSDWLPALDEFDTPSQEEAL